MYVEVEVDGNGYETEKDNNREEEVVRRVGIGLDENKPTVTVGLS